MYLQQNKEKINNKRDTLHYYYKDNDQKIIFYKIKTSPGRKTYPGPKQIHRILDKSLNVLSCDIITLEDEIVVDSLPLLKKIIEIGYNIYPLPSLKEIQKYYKDQLQTISSFTDLYKIPESFPVKYSQNSIKYLLN